MSAQEREARRRFAEVKVEVEASQSAEKAPWIPMCRVTLMMPEADIMWLRQKIRDNISKGKNYIEVVDDKNLWQHVEMHIQEILIQQ
jgi:hypothetical protein